MLLEAGFFLAKGFPSVYLVLPCFLFIDLLHYGCFCILFLLLGFVELV